MRSKVSIVTGAESRVQGDGPIRRSVRPAALRFSDAGKLSRVSSEFGSAVSPIQRLSCRRSCIFPRCGTTGFRFRKMWSLSRLNETRRLGGRRSDPETSRIAPGARVATIQVLPHSRERPHEWSDKTLATKLSTLGIQGHTRIDIVRPIRHPFESEDQILRRQTSDFQSSD